MLPSTSPRAILYLPNPLQESVVGPSQPPAQRREAPQRCLDDWVEVDGPATGHRIYLDPGVRQTLRRPDGHHHLSVPVCEDPERLGQQGLATVYRVQLNVFSKLAKEVLPRASGPKVRQYFDRAYRGAPEPLAESTGLTLAELIHFREYFGRLPDYPAGQSLNRPELLAVAEHLLGGSAQTGSGAVNTLSAREELLYATAQKLGGSFGAIGAAARLWELAKRRRERLELGIKATLEVLAGLKADRPGSRSPRLMVPFLEARLAELDCYLGLVKTMTAVLREPSVQTLLAPEAALSKRARKTGIWVAQQASNGAGRLSGAMVNVLHGHAQAIGPAEQTANLARRFEPREG